MIDFFKKRPKDVTSTEAAIECFKMGNYDEALMRADAIIEAQPEVALSHRFKGEVLYQMERYRECIESFLRAEEIGGPGTEEVFFWRARAYANAGDSESAVEILLKYVDGPQSDLEMVERCKAAISRFTTAS